MFQFSTEFCLGSSPSGEPEEQRDDKYGYEDIEENLRNSRRSSRYPAKAKDCRDNRDYQEY